MPDRVRVWPCERIYLSACACALIGSQTAEREKGSERKRAEQMKSCGKGRGVGGEVTRDKSLPKVERREK